MPKDTRPPSYSDGEILDLIEDFLVNHFTDDDPEPHGPELIEMLKHIANLVELRSTKGNVVGQNGDQEKSEAPGSDKL